MYSIPPCLALSARTSYFQTTSVGWNASAANCSEGLILLREGRVLTAAMAALAPETPGTVSDRVMVFSYRTGTVRGVACHCCHPSPVAPVLDDKPRYAHHRWSECGVHSTDAPANKTSEYFYYRDTSGASSTPLRLQPVSSPDCLDAIHVVRQAACRPRCTASPAQAQKGWWPSYVMSADTGYAN